MRRQHSDKPVRSRAPWPRRGFPAVIRNASWVVHPRPIAYTLIGALLLTGIAPLAVAADLQEPPAPVSASALEAGDSPLPPARSLKQQQYAVADQLSKDYPDAFDAWRVLGTHSRVDPIRVHWIGGGVDVLKSAAADQRITITESGGRTSDRR